MAQRLPSAPLFFKDVFRPYGFSFFRRATTSTRRRRRAMPPCLRFFAIFRGFFAMPPILFAA